MDIRPNYALSKVIVIDVIFLSVIQRVSRFSKSLSKISWGSVVVLSSIRMSKFVDVLSMHGTQKNYKRCMCEMANMYNRAYSSSRAWRV